MSVLSPVCPPHSPEIVVKILVQETPAPVDDRGFLKKGYETVKDVYAGQVALPTPSYLATGVWGSFGKDRKTSLTGKQIEDKKKEVVKQSFSPASIMAFGFGTSKGLTLFYINYRL